MTADVRFGSKADICSAKRHVRFTPNRGHSRELRLMRSRQCEFLSCMRRNSLAAGSRNKAPDLRAAFIVLVWPYDGEPKFVWCSYQRIEWHLDPLAVKSHSIFAVLRIPIHILDALAISERAAKPSPACKAVKPPLERRVFIFSIANPGKNSNDNAAQLIMPR